MATTTGEKSPAQKFALVFGAVYALVGLLGFLVADQFTGGDPNDRLIIFPVNHLHNLVHLAIGAAWLLASRRHDTAKAVNTVIGATYLLVALLGFADLAFMHTLLNIHDSGSSDNFLHLASGLLSLYFGTVGASGNRGGTTARSTTRTMH